MVERKIDFCKTVDGNARFSVPDTGQVDFRVFIFERGWNLGDRYHELRKKDGVELVNNDGACRR